MVKCMVKGNKILKPEGDLEWKKNNNKITNKQKGMQVPTRLASLWNKCQLKGILTAPMLVINGRIRNFFSLFF